MTPARLSGYAVRSPGSGGGRDYHSEGRRALARALAASPNRTAARAKALNGAGWLAHHQRDIGEARELLTESLTVARELDDQGTAAWTLHGMGRVAYFDNDAQSARLLGEESLAIALEVGDQSLIAWAHHLLGLAAYIAADDATARIHYERSLAIRRKLGFDEGIAILLSLLGLVAVRRADLGQAHALYRETLFTSRGLLGPWSAAMPLAALSHIAAAWSQPGAAVSARRPKGAWAPIFNVVAAVAGLLVISAYLGVAEAAFELALQKASRKRDDPDVWQLIGEMENALATGQLAVQSAIDTCAEYTFRVDQSTANTVLIRKTIAAQSLMTGVEKALEVVGGSGIYRSTGLERLVRDIHGVQFHPLQAKRQYRFTGRMALGLDPVD
jgi:hypothetical protein